MRIFIASLFLVLALPAFGQALPPGVTPQMIQQVQSMSPAQQQALAKQFGVQIPGQASASQTQPLALPGQQITPQVRDSVTKTKEAAPQEVKQQASQRFGRNLFSRTVSTFAPTDDAPVPENYRLGVGDQLIVQMFGKENEQLTLQLGRNGDVAFPKLGSITLSGLTFEDARELIKTRVNQQLIGVEATVTMGRLRAINVFMAGEVEVPGAYSVSALTTVTQALFQAGGVSEIGSLRNIQVRRSGQVAASFDAYDLLMRGDTQGDIRLQSGDVVFVPAYKGVVEVTGEVKRPRIYELVGGETVSDVLSMAAGFTQQAHPSLSVLIRKSETGGLPTAKSINLYEPSVLASAIQSGDLLRVQKTGGRVSNTVGLQGAVQRPGTYGWFEGMRVSDLLGDVRRDVLREADLSYGIVVTYKNDLLDIDVKQFELIKAVSAPNTPADPLLSEFDEVLVFSLPELEGVETDARNSRRALLAPVVAKLSAQAREDEPVQTVSISGAVRAPGVYPLFAGTTVADLVKAAGGLKDSAYLQAAELRRLVEQQGGEVVASYSELNLARVLKSDASPVLTSRDHLTIRDIPDWSPQDAITVSGEVAFPGTYLIQRGETLADVIDRAGGLTEEAFPEGAIFTRKSVAQKEAERARAFAANIRQTFASRLLTEETTTQPLGEVASIANTLEAFEGQGRLLIDLPAALERQAVKNLEVVDGDRLVIPKKLNTVTIVGEVLQQGTHSYSSSLSVEDYLGLSAGLTARADDGGIYVVKADGSVTLLDNSWWRFGASRQQLQPGDTIVVPVNTRYKEQLTSWREITQIVYQGLVSVAAVASL